jgi:general secretion pathway protein G
MIKTKPGFSLIELMAVIVILGILTTIVAVNVAPFLQRANVEKVRADISQLEKAVELYKFNELKYPTTDQGIDALVSPPSDLKRPYLYPKDGYIAKAPLDPWGNPYLYLHPSVHGKNFDIFSYGADGVEGGVGEDADIGNWME